MRAFCSARECEAPARREIVARGADADADADADDEPPRRRRRRVKSVCDGDIVFEACGALEEAYPDAPV